MNLQQQITAFIASNSLPEPSIKVGDTVVYTHTKDEPTPAIVREVLKDANGLCANLTVYLPDFNREVEGIGGTNIKVTQRYFLKEQQRARVYLTYPEIMFSKGTIKLDNPFVAEGKVMQSESDIWYPSAVASSPRLYGIQTNQVGRFFDPRFYKFQIYCRKDSYLDLHNKPVDVEQQLFPLISPVIAETAEVGKGFLDLIRKPKVPANSTPQAESYYESFFTCYEEFFKQKYQLLHPATGDVRWDVVEIRAFYKEQGGLVGYGQQAKVAAYNDGGLAAASEAI